MRLSLQWVVIGCLVLAGCGDDAAESGGDGGSSGRRDAGDPDGGGGGGAGGSSGRDSELGPTANVRIVNLVPDVTFAAWGPDTESRPVMLADDIEYATISDYIAMPVNRVSQEPIFVLRPSGDAPEEGRLFSMLQENDREHVRIEVRELEGPGEYATILVAPMDDDADSILEFQTLDEEDTDRGESSQANLHIVTFWEPLLATGVVPAIALPEEPCLFSGSSSLSVARPVPPGAITLGYHDLQTITQCEGSDPIETFALNVAAGDNELVVLYLEGDELKMLHAPIHEP